MFINYGNFYAGDKPLTNPATYGRRAFSKFFSTTTISPNTLKAISRIWTANTRHSVSNEIYDAAHIKWQLFTFTYIDLFLFTLFLHLYIIYKRQLNAKKRKIHHNKKPASEGNCWTNSTKWFIKDLLKKNFQSWQNGSRNSNIKIKCEPKYELGIRRPTNRQSFDYILHINWECSKAEQLHGWKNPYIVFDFNNIEENKPPCDPSSHTFLKGREQSYELERIRYRRVPISDIVKHMNADPLIDVLVGDEFNTTQKCSACISQLFFDERDKIKRNLYCGGCTLRSSILPIPNYHRFITMKPGQTITKEYQELAIHGINKNTL